MPPILSKKSEMSTSEIIAVDIGNSRAKFGRYARNAISLSGNLPEPVQVIVDDTPELSHLNLGLLENPLPEGSEWLVSSVNEEGLAGFCEWALANRPNDTVRILTQRDVPLPIEVDEPNKVGLDRLCNALAATCLARQGEPVLVVDVGSAATFDILSSDNRFLGGAILPGFRAAATALGNAASLLPEINANDLRFPAYPGKNTVAAIESGLFWGMVGAIRQFLAFAQEGHSQALLLLTGGDAFPVLEALLNPKFNPQADNIIAEATRVADPTGISCPPVIETDQSQAELEAMPDNSFVPVAQFHEAICCPYLTLSGIALCSLK